MCNCQSSTCHRGCIWEWKELVRNSVVSRSMRSHVYENNRIKICIYRAFFECTGFNVIVSRNTNLRLSFDTLKADFTSRDQLSYSSRNLRTSFLTNSSSSSFEPPPARVEEKKFRRVMKRQQITSSQRTHMTPDRIDHDKLRILQVWHFDCAVFRLTLNIGWCHRSSAMISPKWLRTGKYKSVFEGMTSPRALILLKQAA